MSLALALGVATVVGCGGKEDSSDAPTNGGSTSTGGATQGGASASAGASARGGTSAARGGTSAAGGDSSMSMGGIIAIPPYGLPPIVD